MSTCPCKACQAIPTLDLKFMVHHGDFIIQQVAGIKDLLGTDVNLIHRLAKNHVSEFDRLAGLRTVHPARIRTLANG